jgi:hypothetical protein
MKTLLLAAVASLACASSLFAATKVVSSGDSLMCLISSDMPAALAAFGTFDYPTPILGNGGSDTAMGDITSRHWIGSESFGSPEQTVDFRTNCVKAHPDVVLLMIGANDAFGDYGTYWNQWSYDRFKANVDMGVQSIQEAGIPVVLGAITPCNEEVAAAYRGTVNTHPNARFDQYNAWLQQEADLRGCLFLDTDTMMRSVPNWQTTMLGVDGLNYSAAGSVFMANQFAQAAELVSRSGPNVITNVKVSSLSVSSLYVTANLAADSIVAGRMLKIGGSVAAVPEPSALALMLTTFLGGLLWLRPQR